jgi:hypothetical protein
LLVDDGSWLPNWPAVGYKGTMNVPSPRFQAAWLQFGCLFLAVLLLALLLAEPFLPRASAQVGACAGEFLPVSTPLNDLGPNIYVRMDGQNTGEAGGLYPAGSNDRPPAHEAAGVAIGSQVVPLNGNGEPDLANGRIVMISVGMSNTAAEFQTFINIARDDPDLNPQLRLVNGAQPGQTSPDWVDPDAPTWHEVDNRLAAGGLTPAQVQIAWVKLVQVGPHDFPAGPLSLQADLAQVARNLLTNYPNMRLAFFSSRTRSYTYWQGLSPEPSAFESGFAVKWLIENQINGDPDLNYDPNLGPVVAPFLSWGAHLWIDGLNPRSDGMVWLPEDMAVDCTHPSDNGRLKVANMLLSYFKADAAAVPWFTDSGLPPTLTATPIGTPTATGTDTPPPSATPTTTITPAATATTSATPAVTVTPMGPGFLHFLPFVSGPAADQPAGPAAAGSGSGPGSAANGTISGPARMLLNTAFILLALGMALLSAGAIGWLRHRHHLV